MSDDLPVNFEARNRLRSIVNRTQEVTPLRAVASRAIQLAEDERSAAMDLATVLSSDQALTARLLRLSNSAYYGYARRISNVREAVILLGMRTVRSVAITSGIIDAMRVPDAGSFQQDLFWAHSVCVGLVAETIARETKAARPEDAFTAGVLHDVGKLAMIITEPERFAEVLDLTEHENMRYRDAEYAVFGVTHQQVGGRLAERWKFPEALVNAVKSHHPARPVSSIENLDDILAVANLACNREGLACGFDYTSEPARKAIEALPSRAEDAIRKVHGGMPTLEEKARAFLLHVTSRAPGWYASDRKQHTAETSSGVVRNVA
jgi:putative nucleotidyltransferase with HDIG domain